MKKTAHDPAPAPAAAGNTTDFVPSIGTLHARLARRHGPDCVEYSLTPLGREVSEQVRQLTDWIEENLGRTGTGQPAHGAE